MTLSALRFDQEFTRFKRQVRAEGGHEFVSFHEGVPAEWEAYKILVRQRALHLLDFEKWKRSQVGSGRILRRAIQAIEIDDGDEVRNNMVDWRPRYGPTAQAHRRLLAAENHAASRRAFEQWLFDFFRREGGEEAAFSRFCELAGERYALVAYLFFLRDCQRFAPIRNGVFDEAFRRLGIELVTRRQCTWANYCAYNNALAGIQRALQDIGGQADARLIDAHSFCWMLMRLPKVASPRMPPIPLPQPLETVAEAPPASIDDPSSLAQEGRIVPEEFFANLDAARRRNGRLAEEIALHSERQRLKQGGRDDLARQVTDVSAQPARGYDISSFELDGSHRPIEVKAAEKTSKRLEFFVTQNEWNQSRRLPNYRFYAVTKIGTPAQAVYELRPSHVASCLIPESYRASLRTA